MAEGYYEATTLSAVDADLVAGNIKKGVQIFQVTGNFVAASVAKTGQTTTYAARDDGALEKGVEWPSPRFTDNNNGTVTDNLTKLVWLKNANCFGVESLWTDALSNCNSLATGSCGLTDGSSIGDWRLPNIKELFSLIDMGRGNPALPLGHPFTNVQLQFYWSSTTSELLPGEAWRVNPHYGEVRFNNKLHTSCVWPVRDEQ